MKYVFCLPLSKGHNTCRKEFAALKVNYFLNGVEATIKGKYLVLG